MKKVTEIVDSIGPYGVRDDWVTALRDYGAQVREEAAKVAENPYSDEVQCYVFNKPLKVGKNIAAAIRKMELP